MQAAVLRQYGAQLSVVEMELDRPLAQEVVVRTAASGRVIPIGSPNAVIHRVLGHCPWCWDTRPPVSSRALASR